MFYSIFDHRRQQIVFGERPEALKSVETINQRIWGSHQIYLKRLENSPLKKATYYRQLQESTGIKSVRGLAEITGEDWSYIAKVLKVLELPEPIQDYLKTHQESEIVRRFHLGRLLEIRKIHDEQGQVEKFRILLGAVSV